MRDQTKYNLRVGLLTAAALGVLAVAILSIGTRMQLFTLHTRYHTTFRNVTGLQRGAQVNLNGVTVGFVESIELPTDPNQQRIIVRFSLDAAYTERIRTDTTVSIKTIGLLGDKYMELQGGSPEAERVLEGGEVRGEDAAEMAELMASGEDLMDNLLSISASLKVILRRVEAGEGLIGELTSSPEGSEKVRDLLTETLTGVRDVVDHIDSGEGLLGRLVTDQEFADHLVGRVESATQSVETVAGTMAQDLERDGTVYASLVRNPEGAAQLEGAVAAINDAGLALAAAAEELATGDGTLPRLMQDEEYANDFLEELHALVVHLRSVAAKVDTGDGTAGALVNDPQIYKDLENVVRGVKSSKVLSWFIRNRRKKGEKVLTKELREQIEGDAGLQRP